MFARSNTYPKTVRYTTHAVHYGALLPEELYICCAPSVGACPPRTFRICEASRKFLGWMKFLNVFLCDTIYTELLSVILRTTSNRWRSASRICCDEYREPDKRGFRNASVLHETCYWVYDFPHVYLTKAQCNIIQQGECHVHDYHTGCNSHPVYMIVFFHSVLSCCTDRCQWTGCSTKIWHVTPIIRRGLSC